MSESDPQPDSAALTGSGTIDRRGALGVAIASLISAGVGYLVIWLAARTLVPTEVNNVFVTFWSTLFACFGILSGLSIETTRAVTSTAAAERSGVPQDARNPRVLAVGLGLGVAAAAVLASSSPLWAPRLFATDATPLAMLVSVGVAAYAAHSTVVGALAGRRRWSTYSVLITAESVVRMVLVLCAAAVGATVLGFAAGSALGAVTWAAVVALSPAARRAAGTRADSRLPVLLRRIGAAALATGASALLMVGFPVLLSLTTSHAQYKMATPFLIAISWTRAPLMIPLNAYQGVAVSHFVLQRSSGMRAMLPAVRAIVAVGLVGTALAYAAGPWLMATLLGPEYRVSGPLLGGLTGASAFLALLTLTGAFCQALTMHRVFVAGWVVAVAVAIGALLLPLDLPGRTLLGLTVGPLVGIAVHVRALRRAEPAASAAAPTDEATT